MRALIALILIAISFEVLSDPMATELCIQNVSDKVFYAWGYDVVASDWQDVVPGTNMRPDCQWWRLRVGHDETICKRVELAKTATIGDIADMGPSFEIRMTEDPANGEMTISRMTSVCTQRQYGICKKQQWQLDNLKSAFDGALGRLHGSFGIKNSNGEFIRERPHKCPDKQGSVKSCSMFRVMR